MGYYVQTELVDFRIPCTKIPDAFAILKYLNDPKFEHLKRGGSYSGGKKTGSWYAWMPADYHLTVKSVKDVFELLGFQDCVEDGTGFMLGSYDSKTGNEDIFLNAVAKCAMPGKIVWRGEDGSRWENRFENGKMTTVELNGPEDYDEDDDEY